MTQEEKELLVKDLCARLPYKNKIKGVLSYDKDKEIFTIEGYEIEKEILYLSNSEGCHVDDFKPYLRQMSSMTDEEFKTYEYFFNEDGLIDCSVDVYVDWLISCHFDFRGLIPMGLALEAPKDMYVAKN